VLQWKQPSRKQPPRKKMPQGPTQRGPVPQGPPRGRVRGRVRQGPPRGRVRRDRALRKPVRRGAWAGRVPRMGRRRSSHPCWPSWPRWPRSVRVQGPGCWSASWTGCAARPFATPRESGSGHATSCPTPSASPGWWPPWPLCRRVTSPSTARSWPSMRRTGPASGSCKAGTPGPLRCSWPSTCSTCWGAPPPTWSPPSAGPCSTRWSSPARSCGSAGRSTATRPR
jgi:hypothetical protein